MMGTSGTPDREEAGMSLLRRVIGGVLRRIRLRQGRTLREVAQAAGVSLPYLSEVERGRKEASSEVLAAICRALGIHLADLLEEARDELRRERPTPVGPGISAARFDRVPVARTGPQARVGPPRLSVTRRPTVSPRPSVTCRPAVSLRPPRRPSAGHRHAAARRRTAARRPRARAARSRPSTPPRRSGSAAASGSG